MSIPGLRLELFAEIQEYPSGVTEAKGLSVTIHPFGTMPFPEISGISVSPGFETNIGIQYVRAHHGLYVYFQATDYFATFLYVLW